MTTDFDSFDGAVGFDSLHESNDFTESPFHERNDGIIHAPGTVFLYYVSTDLIYFLKPNLTTQAFPPIRGNVLTQFSGVRLVTIGGDYPIMHICDRAGNIFTYVVNGTKFTLKSFLNIPFHGSPFALFTHGCGGTAKRIYIFDGVPKAGHVDDIAGISVIDLAGNVIVQKNEWPIAGGNMLRIHSGPDLAGERDLGGSDTVCWVRALTDEWDFSDTLIPGTTSEDVLKLDGNLNLLERNKLGSPGTGVFTFGCGGKSDRILRTIAKEHVIISGPNVFASNRTPSTAMNPWSIGGG